MQAEVYEGLADADFFYIEAYNVIADQQNARSARITFT